MSRLLLLLLVAGCAQPGPGVVGSQGLAVSSPITLLDDLGAAADVTVALGATDDYWADTIDGFDQRSAGDATFALAVDFDPTATGADEQALWGTNSDGQSWSLTYVPDEMELRLRWGDGLSESLVSRTLSTAELDAAELELVWSWTASTCSAQGVQTLWLDGVFAGRDATGNGIWSTGGIGALGVQLTHLEDGSGTDVTNVAFAAGTMDLTEGLQLWVDTAASFGVADVDGDSVDIACDNCIAVANASQEDADGDYEGDVCDTDSDTDGDGVVDADDGAVSDPTLCQDLDSDTCDDCSVVNPADPADDGADQDGDGLCDAGDGDTDGDGVDDVFDDAPTNPNECLDLDADGCDDCSSGTVDAADDGLDTDADGLCDLTDTDDDGDTIADGIDPEPLDPSVCGNSDGDACDDCAVTLGPPDPADDGTDTDSDGACDASDTDDDGDIIPDIVDVAPLDPARCQDADGDGCDDCAVTLGPPDPDDDGPDADGDGVCDAAETDADDDGVADADDLDPLDPAVCRDVDLDTCDDCISGADAPEDDGIDADGDGLCDLGDPDDDNDGIPDAIEGEGDPDGDLFPNRLDDDSDGDGIPDATEGSVDSDGDGVGDFLDLDSDDDTIPDLIEGTVDIDGDGLPNYLDEESDGDLFADAAEGIEDVDGDGLLDFEDPVDDDGPIADPDGDGMDNATEAALGLEGYDSDTDGDGYGDGEEIGDPDDPTDTDGDGAIDANDTDDDEDGISTEDERLVDTDGDGQPNPDFDGDGTDNAYDEDSDDDGIVDLTEGDVDSDGDGLADYLDDDSDDDGILDATEQDVDSDGDGEPDYLDLDSDDDGLSDEVEGDGDFDEDGEPDYLDLDSDDDGLPDELEGDGDSEGSGRPDYLDSDSDGDGISDEEETAEDTDGDGVPNYLDLDSDDDGIPDSVEAGQDGDGDGVSDPIDADNHDGPDGDADGDSLSNVDEEDLGTDPLHPDTDGDRVDDGTEVDLGTDPLAADTDGDGVDDGAELAAGTDPTIAQDDRDVDGVLNADDNCPSLHNPSQSDEDEDGVGDACDLIEDLDGYGPGGGCEGATASVGGAGGFVGMLLLLLVRRRRWAWTAVFAALIATPAFAQDVAVDGALQLEQFEPRPGASGILNAPTSGVLPAHTLTLDLFGHYSHRPLVLRPHGGGDGLAAIAGQMRGELLVGYGFLGWGQVGAALPWSSTVAAGDVGFASRTVDQLQGTYLGDLRLHADVDLLEAIVGRDKTAGMGFGAGLSVWLPTGRLETLTGEVNPRVEPRVAFDWTAPFGLRVGANVGFHLRSRADLQGYVNHHRLRWNAYVSTPIVLRELEAMLTAHGAAPLLPSQASGDATPVELLGGVRYRTPFGLRVEVAAGGGLTSAVGAPEYRIVGRVGYEISMRRAGTLADGDEDGDGVLDRDDLCPYAAESVNDLRDADGCPDDAATLGSKALAVVEAVDGKVALGAEPLAAAAAGSTMKDGDVLQVGPGGSARARLADGSLLLVERDATVRPAFGNTGGVQLLKGRTEVIVAPDQELSLVSPQGTVTLRGHARFDQGTRTLKVEVLRGEASLVAGGEPVTMAAGTARTISTGSAGEERILLPEATVIAPKDGEVAAGVRLRWKRVQGAYSYGIQFAPDATFSVGVRTEYRVGTTTRLPEIAPGTWYWRVFALDRGERPGVPGRAHRIEVR